MGGTAFTLCDISKDRGYNVHAACERVWIFSGITQYYFLS